METWIVACAKCGFRWHRVGNLSEYERQSVESRPCPGCGGYTLACREPDRTPPRPRPRNMTPHRHAA